MTGPVPTQQARLRAAFAQAYGQAYEQARGATLEGAASDLEAMDITMERERLQRARDEQNRRLWIQFCEGVVRIVEDSGYLNTSEWLPVARLILRIDSFEGFLRLRAEDPVTHHRVLSTFPRLHTELVVIREIPSVDFTSFSDAERSLGPGANFFMLYAAGWHVRLHQHGQRISAEFPLGQRVIEETREEFEKRARGPRVTSSEIQSPRARLETETPDNIFTSTKPRDLIVFQVNRQRWIEASPSIRARIIEALATRIEAAIQELGNEHNHVQVRASLGPESSAPLVYEGNEQATPQADQSVRSMIRTGLDVLADPATSSTAEPGDHPRGRRARHETLIVTAYLEPDLEVSNEMVDRLPAPGNLET